MNMASHFLSKLLLPRNNFQPPMHNYHANSVQFLSLSLSRSVHSPYHFHVSVCNLIEETVKFHIILTGFVKFNLFAAIIFQLCSTFIVKPSVKLISSVWIISILVKLNFGQTKNKRHVMEANFKLLHKLIIHLNGWRIQSFVRVAWVGFTRYYELQCDGLFLTLQYKFRWCMKNRWYLHTSKRDCISISYLVSMFQNGASARSTNPHQNEWFPSKKKQLKATYTLKCDEPDNDVFHPEEIYEHCIVIDVVYREISC